MDYSRLEDPETGYLLSESIAIMCYLCNKHKWDDLYPEDPELRGKVDHYLHYHHEDKRHPLGTLRQF